MNYPFSRILKKEKNDYSRQKIIARINIRSIGKISLENTRYAWITHWLGRVHNDTSVFCELSVKNRPTYSSPFVGTNFSTRFGVNIRIRKRLQIAVHRRICYIALGFGHIPPLPPSSKNRRYPPRTLSFAKSSWTRCVYTAWVLESRTRPETKRPITKIVDMIFI